MNEIPQLGPGEQTVDDPFPELPVDPDVEVTETAARRPRPLHSHGPTSVSPPRAEQWARVCGRGCRSRAAVGRAGVVLDADHQVHRPGAQVLQRRRGLLLHDLDLQVRSRAASRASTPGSNASAGVCGNVVRNRPFGLASALASSVRTASSAAMASAAYAASRTPAGVSSRVRPTRRSSLASASRSSFASCTDVTVSLLTAELPVVPGILLAVVLLAVGPRLMPRLPRRTPPGRAWWTTALTCLSATVVVAAAILGSRFAGPHLVGALTAFPAVSLTLAVVVGCRDGRHAGAAVLDGLVRGLPSYLVFCLVVAAAAPHVGLAEVPLGMLAAVATAFLTWRGVAMPRGHRVTLVDAGS